jgi:hypothetical protein
MRRKSGWRIIGTSAQAQVRRATELEREILRVEDRYHALLAKIASRSVSIAEVKSELELLAAQQATLRELINEARRGLDEIYGTAFDERIESLANLEGLAGRLSRNRASSPDPT